MSSEKSKELETVPVKYESSKVNATKGDNLLAPKLSLLPELKIYKRRWAILAVFMSFGLISSMSWIQYSIITNIVMRYYNVSSYAVDWTSLIFMIVYVPLVFPASYVLDKKGLRFCTLVGTLLTALGTWIKVASISQDRFVVAFIGHTLIGISQVFLLSVPPKLAAVWFGANQVSTACSLAVFGNQVGVALGFLMPPMIIGNHENIEDIGADMTVFAYGMAISASFVFAMTVFIFEKSPPVPPSIAQALQLKNDDDGFWASMKRLAANRGFRLLVVSYGINLAVFNAISTFLNQLIMQYFEGGEEFGGRVGLVMVVSGMFGSVVGGIVLDKTHKFKETTLALFIFSLIGMSSFAYTLQLQSHLVVYGTSVLLGFCLGGYMPVGFELAMELTYPEPEGTSCGVVMFFCASESFLLTLVYSWLLAAIGDIWTNTILCVLLLVGTVLTACIPSRMRRQEARK